MEIDVQKMRLVIWGAICLYEGQGLEIPGILEAHNRKDLLIVLDALILVLHWIQEELIVRE